MKVRITIGCSGELCIDLACWEDWDLDTVKMLMSMFVSYASGIIFRMSNEYPIQDTDRSGTITFSGQQGPNAWFLASFDPLATQSLSVFGTTSRSGRIAIECLTETDQGPSTDMNWPRPCAVLDTTCLP